MRKLRTNGTRRHCSARSGPTYSPWRPITCSVRQLRQSVVTPVPALIFDCDGVLADTERHGHLPAFNQTFAEFGLPVAWSEDDYAEKLKIGGGKERMSSLLTPAFIAEAGLPTDAVGQKEAVAAWHKRKTEIYTAMVAEGRLPARPGIARLVEEAAAAGWSLAVASTSAEPSVRAVLEHAVGPDRAASFTVLAGDVVPRKKPAPDIYLLTLERLGGRCIRGRRGRRQPQRAGGSRRRRDRLSRDRQRLHRARGLLRGRPRRHEPRRPRR